ncbi:hypothetical protein FOWG_17681 [Fusarium oxysporum f. sp. lycopersici MN25]|nr:hypothetical protein FOWG_17681 [Fusarium oxysporum f. sp. lycopersici MN25]
MRHRRLQYQGIYSEGLGWNLRLNVLSMRVE